MSDPIAETAAASPSACFPEQPQWPGDGTHRISLDQAIDTMRRTGADMQAKYKETSQGGLALAQVEC